jgi:hypothetical protein
MRRVIRGSARRTDLQKRAEEAHVRFAVLISVIEDFARQFGYTVTLDTAENSVAEPQCILQGVSRAGITISFCMTGSPGNLHISALCWNEKSSLASRNWQSYALDAKRDLRSLLREAREWAETVRDLS